MPVLIAAGHPQATFNVTEFETAIAAHGLDYRWSRATLCPCRMGLDGDSFDPACDRCTDGWLYVRPNYGKAIYAEDPRWQVVKAIFSSMTLDPTTHEWVQAPWVSGRGTLTVSGEMPVSFKDKFVSLSQRMTFSQLLMSDGEEIVKIGYRGRTRDEQRASMRYEPMAINYIEDINGVVYKKQIDFTILAPTQTEPSRLKWVTARGPAAGVGYTVSYDCHPVWVVDEATYAVQNSLGPPKGLTGQTVVQYLPTTYAVVLDFLSEKQGS